jgi:hypothetical protein
METLKEENQAVYLYYKIAEAISKGRTQVATTANLVMVHTYYEIGRMIVEEEQGGEKRASYGKKVLKFLSVKLTREFGKGFSVENLDRMRFFYKSYSIPISSTLLTKLENKPKFKLSWSHYLVLMRIENVSERQFYEVESSNCNWSLKDLQKQLNSSLYERLVLSRDK